MIQANTRPSAELSARTRLSAAIRRQSATVGVVGLGYVGLPLVQALVDAGFTTVGFDTNPRKIARLREGRSYVHGVEDAWIARAVEEDRFDPTTAMDRLAEADAVLICVPTPLSASRDPDLSYVEETARQIAGTLRQGQLVVLESTTYPGTTRQIVLPILRTSGLVCGEDFFLAYCPEREDPGNHSLARGEIPRVVGGVDATSRQLAETLYGRLVQRVVGVSSCEVAEAAKILENTYRAVNIALVNELKLLFERMQIDVWEVIEAAGTKPFGFEAFHPGPGLGGHCLPVDPFYLSWLARTLGGSTRFIELAGEINRMMPEYVVARVTAALNSQSKPLRGSNICLLGIAYKPDVNDPRESPAFVLLEKLQAEGAKLSYHDPYIPRLPPMRNHSLIDLESSPLTEGFLADQDCLVIVTNHSCFDYEFIIAHASLVVDTRNAVRHFGGDGTKVWKA